jgi:hypothetical protein
MEFSSLFSRPTPRHCHPTRLKQCAVRLKSLTRKLRHGFLQISIWRLCYLLCTQFVQENASSTAELPSAAQHVNEEPVGYDEVAPDESPPEGGWTGGKESLDPPVESPIGTSSVHRTVHSTTSFSGRMINSPAVQELLSRPISSGGSGTYSLEDRVIRLNPGESSSPMVGRSNIHLGDQRSTSEPSDLALPILRDKFSDSLCISKQDLSGALIDEVGLLRYYRYQVAPWVSNFSLPNSQPQSWKLQHS